MWWVLIVVFLFARRSVASASAPPSVGSPTGQPLTILTTRPPITSPPFLKNPDIGTFGVTGPTPTFTPPPVQPQFTITGQPTTVIEHNMFTPGTDDPAINTQVGPPPTDPSTPLAPGNSIQNLIVMAPPPPEPMVPPIPAGFTQIAPGISIPTGSNDGIVMTPRISQL
jgi:hypothetical protein